MRTLCLLALLCLTSGCAHLASGVRHIVWDSGRGLEPKSANASSIVIFAFAVAATVSVWGIAAMTGAI